jgi:lysophospholipase L1-like esterase
MNMFQNTSVLRKALLVITANLVLFSATVAVIEFTSSLLVSIPGGSLVTHPRLNHIWRPGSSYRHDEWVSANPEFPEPYTHYYNQQGWLENYDIEKTKPDKIYRIFYLGDSFTEGTCPMDQSVPSVVESRLNDLAKNRNMHFEVINTGTSSYSPTIFYLLVRYVLTDYSPDLIVVNVDMTDDFDDWKYGQTLIRDDNLDPLFALPRSIYKSTYIDTEHGTLKATMGAKIQLFLAQNSYTYHLLKKIRNKYYKDSSNTTKHDSTRIASEKYQRWAWCEKDWDDKTTSNVRNTLDLLGRLIEWCKQNNIKIMLTGVPHYWQYAGNADGSGSPLWSERPHYELATVAENHGIPYLNSYEMLGTAIRGTEQPRYYYNNNMHFNPRGYALWADAHLEFLVDRENKLLPEAYYQAR